MIYVSFEKLAGLLCRSAYICLMAKKKGKVSKPKKPAPAAKETNSDATDKQFDFGGLPARDLKKNLGCG
jgi:hypothetical protein